MHIILARLRSLNRPVFSSIPTWRRTRMARIVGCGWPLRAAACLGCVLIMAGRAWPQSSSVTITLTGQSSIRSDIRVHTPAAVSTLSPLLKGDVVFTNFETTIVEKKASRPERVRVPLPAGVARRADGHRLQPGGPLQQSFVRSEGNRAFSNTLREVKSRNLAHAGIGNTLEEAAAPAYLHTPKGTVALVAMASGLIEKGGSAIGDSAGRE